VVLNCGCCCCCCCCLHTVGSIIGAAIAPAFGKNKGPSEPRYRHLVEEYDFSDYNPTGITNQPSEAPETPNVRKPTGTSGVAIYWYAMLALLVIVLIYGVVSSINGASDGVGGVILGLALGLPGLQLLASLIACLILVASVREDRNFQIIQVGKITLGCVLGTGVGLLIMFGMCGLGGILR
jgi:hypothetical protein